MGSLVFILGFIVAGAALVGVYWLFRQPQTTASEGESNSDMFEKKIRSFYIYLMVIICIFAMVFSVVMVFRNALDVIMPQKQIYSVSEDPKNVAISEQNIKNQAKIDLSSSIASLAIILPILIYHSRLIKQVSKEV